MTFSQFRKGRHCHLLLQLILRQYVVRYRYQSLSKLPSAVRYFTSFGVVYGKNIKLIDSF